MKTFEQLSATPLCDRTKDELYALLDELYRRIDRNPWSNSLVRQIEHVANHIDYRGF